MRSKFYLDWENAYKLAVIRRFQTFLNKISALSFIKKAELDKNGKIHIEFIEPVDIDGQDIINVFVRGGVIKKSKKYKDPKDQYFEIPPFGEI